MKCAQHPDREAVARCAACDTALCEECALPGEAGTVLCNKCLALAAAGEVTEETRQKVTESAARRARQEEAKVRRSRLRLIVPIALVVLICIANLILFMTAPVPEIEAFVASEYPVASLVIVDAAIRDYLQENGEAPADLNALRGDYLPAELMDSDELEAYRYRRTSPRTWELSLLEPPEDATPELVLTEGGPR